MKKYLLLVALILFLFIPISFAFSSCSNVTLTVTEPENLSYTSSINIPLEYATVNSSDCWMDLDNNKRSYNISLDCSQTSSRFDVDYDGNYSFTAWASNSSSGDCNVTGEFIVDRTSEFEEAKPIVMMLVIGCLIIFGLVVMAFGRILDKKYQALVNILSFMFVYSAFGLILLAVREYIKVPSIYDLLATTYWAVMIILTLLASIIIVLFITDFIKKKMKELKDKQAGISKDEM